MTFMMPSCSATTVCWRLRYRAKRTERAMSASIAKPVVIPSRIENADTFSNMLGSRLAKLLLELDKLLVAVLLEVVELFAAAQSSAYHCVKWDCSTQSHTKFESQVL